MKAVNTRDRNFTKAKIARRLKDVDKQIETYLDDLAASDRI
ncbi:MAG: hypothetical protein P8Q92_01170 [Pseudoprimorskyibacter sp.]|nr:hypothetical protein [Pseudoprimorskyibacter sp.]